MAVPISPTVAAVVAVAVAVVTVTPMPVTIPKPEPEINGRFNDHRCVIVWSPIIYRGRAVHRRGRTINRRRAAHDYAR